MQTRSQENVNDSYKTDDINFTGSFGIITLTNGKLTDLYIRDGSQLSYEKETLTVPASRSAAYQIY